MVEAVAVEQGLKPCPMPWCEARERGPDFHPVVRLHHYGNYRVVCTSCVCEGPLQPTKSEAIAAWNTRATPSQAPTDASTDEVERLRAALEQIESGSWKGITDLILAGMWQDVFTHAQLIARTALSQRRAPASAADQGVGADAEDRAWTWLESNFLNVEAGDDPNDRDYSADEMADAFMAGLAAAPQPAAAPDELRQIFNDPERLTEEPGGVWWSLYLKPEEVERIKSQPAAADGDAA